MQSVRIYANILESVSHGYDCSIFWMASLLRTSYVGRNISSTGRPQLDRPHHCGQSTLLPSPILPYQYFVIRSHSTESAPTDDRCGCFTPFPRRSASAFSHISLREARSFAPPRFIWSQVLIFSPHKQNCEGAKDSETYGARDNCPFLQGSAIGIEHQNRRLRHTMLITLLLGDRDIE